MIRPTGLHIVSAPWEKLQGMGLIPSNGAGESAPKEEPKYFTTQGTEGTCADLYRLNGAPEPYDAGFSARPKVKEAGGASCRPVR